MSRHALCSTAADDNPADRAYIAAHRFMYGEIGERVATAAILFRDKLLRPGFVLPVVRIAPVAPYGYCMALGGNGGSLAHVHEHGLAEGVWLYVHRRFYGSERFQDDVDETVLHELLHNELRQFGQNPKHRGEPWAQRCQELSTRLGIVVRIERPRSIRVVGKVTTGTPTGCLSYADLARWPHPVLNGGPPLRARVLAEAPLCVAAANHTETAAPCLEAAPA